MVVNLNHMLVVLLLAVCWKLRLISYKSVSVAHSVKNSVEAITECQCCSVMGSFVGNYTYVYIKGYLNLTQ